MLWGGSNPLKPTRPTSFLIASFLSVVALAGCYPDHFGVQANGDGGALDFEIQGAAYADGPVLATGFEVQIDVQRFDAQWRSCIIEKNVGSVAPQGCSPEHHEPIGLVDASCDDGACNVTSRADGSGTVHLLVTGTRDGSATLHVNVKSTNDGATWSDAYPLRFSTATRIAVMNGSGPVGDTSYAVMPGASFSWCPELRDASETKLVTNIDAVGMTHSGDAQAITIVDGTSTYVTPGCTAFVGSKAGTATLTFTAGSLTATGSIRVADPSDIVAASLYAYADATANADAGSSTTNADAGPSGDGEIGRPPGLAASPVTSIDVTVGSSFVDYASVLKLKDGTLALGGAGNFVSSSDEALSVTSMGTDPAIAQTDLSIFPMGGVIGDGTVDATFGSVKVSIPFHITR